MDEELVSLTWRENSVLFRFLQKYFSEIEYVERGLIKDKFYLIEKLLYANLGLKEGFLGIKKVAPYKLQDHADVKDELRRQESIIKNCFFEKETFHGLLSKLSKYNDFYFELDIDLVDTSEKDNISWKMLHNNLKNHGVELTIEELKNIVWQ